MSMSVFPCWCFLSQNTCVCGWLCIRVPAGGESVFSTPRLKPVESSPLACPPGISPSFPPAQAELRGPPCYPPCHPISVPPSRSWLQAWALHAPQPLARMSRVVQLQEGLGLHQSQGLFFFLTCGTIPFYVHKTDRFNHVHR